MSRAGNLRDMGLLWALYLVQGLPFGFQVTALPVYLREQGASLSTVGFAGVLALPWMLKPLWAPLVDRFGTRRSWILANQVGLLVACLAAAAVAGVGGAVAWIAASVLLMNFFAAVMDIAVDALAVDLLKESDLGHGNIAQVVGYKLGMLTGGGLLLWASEDLGWRGLFVAMAVLVLVVMLATAAFRSPALAERSTADMGMRHLLLLLLRVFRLPGAGWLVVFVATYKVGESMADAMFKPFLVDHGYSASQIGLWVGTWGKVASVAGSIAGGVLASRVGLFRAVALCSTLRVLPVAGEWWLSVVGPDQARVIAVTCAEHFFGGALTTAMFAFMMSKVDKRIGATHFTALAAIEVWGKAPASWLSGVMAGALGYPPLFAVATLLSALFLGLLWPLGRRR